MQIVNHIGTQMMQFLKAKIYNLLVSVYGLKQKNRLVIKHNFLSLIFQQIKVKYFTIKCKLLFKNSTQYTIEKRFFGLDFRVENNQSFLFPYVNQESSNLKYDCKNDEWDLLIITLQQEISIQIFSNIDEKYSQVYFRYKPNIQIMIYQSDAFEYSDLFLYFSQLNVYQDQILIKIINAAIQIQDCRKIENQKKQSIIKQFIKKETFLFTFFDENPQQQFFIRYKYFIFSSFKFEKQLFLFIQYHFLYEQYYRTINERITHSCTSKRQEFHDQNQFNYNLTRKNKNTLIISFNLVMLQLSQNIKYILFKFNTFNNLLIQNENNQLLLVLELNRQNYLIGFIDSLKSQITLQIQYEKFEEYQYIIQFYLNEEFKGETQINKTIPIYYKISYDLRQQRQSEELLLTNIFLLDNFQIIQPNNEDQQFNGCLLKAVPFYSDIQDSNFCIFYKIDSHNLTILNLNVKNKHLKRNLQESQFIHGSNMRSIVRNMYSASQFQQSITSAQSINTIMIIGYFKLIQTINNYQYLPLITIGVFSEYYNFLNLYAQSATSVELKYIHDTQNVIKKQNQSISNFLQIWIGFGIVYSKADSQAKLVYTNSNKLYSSPIISDATLPSTIATFDVCISCTIEGVVHFGHFDGQVSSVKIIYDVEFSKTDTYYFYNEVTQISKNAILDTSFNLNTYIPNSEYNLGKAIDCKKDYAFFEGVCISQNNCKNLIQDIDKYSSFESGKFYDTSSKKCLNCSSNCLECSSLSICTTCRPSYKIASGKCIRCDDKNSCNFSCPSYLFDSMNQICVNTFSTSSQYLFNLLLSSRLITDNFDVTVVSSPPFDQINNQIVHCYIDTDNNPMTLHSFLGGTSFTTSTVIKKTFNKIPKGYQKIISFYALFYGSGTPQNLQIKINSNIYESQSSSTIVKDKKSCSGSGALTQSIYKNILDLEIQSTSSKWGIRNLQIEISKCHPTCDSCKAGGRVDHCTTCNPNLIQNKFQCMCPYGLYAKYQNCYDSPCITCSLCSLSNCLKCEDITGDCTQCNLGYTIKDGQCVQNSSYNTNDTVFFNFCGVSKEAGFIHFKQNRIVQYGDYWAFYNNNVVPQECMGRQCTPVIGNFQYHHIKLLTLPNYQSYHYQVNLDIEIFAFQTLESNDCVQIKENNKSIFTNCYGQEKYDLTRSNTSNYLFKAQMSFAKDYNELEFLQFISLSNDPNFALEGYSMTEMIFSYSRCHPMCETCNGNTASNCIKCINKASIVGVSCQCKDGFYFSLIRFPTPNTPPGKCQPCNPACETCTGPSPSDCTQCQNGYQIVNNLCKYRCQGGSYWDLTAQQCLSCHVCCKTCDGGQINNCQDCLPEYFLRRIDKSCAIYNVQCQSCTVAVNSLCGGSQNNHQDCLNSGWVVKDDKTCVQCGKFVNGKCAGKYSQNIIDFCNQLGFLYNYDSINCFSCQTLISGISIIDGKCGRNEIQDKCQNYGWKYFNDQTCIDCNPNSQTFRQCVCHKTCQKCLRYNNPLYCETCSPKLFLFQNQCLTKCPNGYTNKEQTCIPCTEKQIPTCVNCYRTCLICDPFDVSLISSSCTACSTLTRQLVNGQCKCLDLNDPNEQFYDTRESFHECSYKNIAVLNAILSNTSSLLTVNFGKELKLPIQFQPQQDEIPDTDGYYESLCKYLFTDQTINLLIGQNSKCQISGSYVSVKLVNSDIFNGDLIQFKKQVLSFVSQNQVLIDTYFNNMVIQTQIAGQTKVQFDYNTVENSCNDIKIKYKNIINHAQRGFKEYYWSLYSYLPENPILQKVLEKLLIKVNSEKKLDVIITKGLIKPNVKVIIRLDFTMKANVISYEELNLSVKPEKKIILDVQSSILIPFYKYQSAILTITSLVIICDPDGDNQINEPLNISISSLEYPDKNYQNPSYEKQEYQIVFQQYTLNPGKIIYNINAKLVSNLFIESSIDFEIDILTSELYVKIVGGNGYFNYKKQVTINGKFRDYDIQNESDLQGFDIQWKCIDSSTQNSCVSRDGKPVIFPSQIPFATIKEFTFNPYSVIKVVLIGSKSPIRQATDAITVMFSEIDLPPLGVQIVTNDPKMQTINLNEEIFVKLDYNSSVNVDLLSYSGTIQYENEVVGIIKFDYTSLRFQIWNYYSAFKRNSIQFQIRFNVFNPQYFMPSIFTSQLNINFPPNKCKFSVTPNIGDSIETKFIMQFQECEDDNQPIYYQFFYYQTSDDFDYEKKNPLQVKRRQLNDKSQNYLIESILPSGQILVLAQAIDSKNAIFNTTFSINVQQKAYQETFYIQLIQQKLDQINKLQASSLISDLSIICDDILKRDEFKSSYSLNSKKIEILNMLNTLQKDLSSLSSFSTVIDKAITSLSISGISYSQSQQSNLLSQLMDSLDQSSILQKANFELSKEKLKQKLYDSFQVVDTFENANQDTQSFDKIIELTDKIGDYLFKNILPNEDPIYFQGKRTSILGTQMTEKYICNYFLCDGSIQPDSTKQAPIYNLKKSEQSKFLYSQDNTFLSYTNSLKELDPDIQIINYPIITPIISTQQNNRIDHFPKQAMLNFPITQDSLKKNMTCISKKEDKGWTKNGCQNIFQINQNQYLCVCDKLSPTTIIDDLEALLYNKNIQTALSSDGIYNILHFNNFYKYVAFWLLTFKTILFIAFYYKGSKLDMLDSKSKLDKIKSFDIFEKSYIVKSNYKKNQVVPQNLVENDIEENNKLKQTKHDTIQTEILNTNSSPQLFQQQEIKRNNQLQKLNSKTENSQPLNYSNNENKDQQRQIQKRDSIKTSLNNTPHQTPNTALEILHEDTDDIFDLNKRRSSTRKNVMIISNAYTGKNLSQKYSQEKINLQKEDNIDDSETNNIKDQTFITKKSIDNPNNMIVELQNNFKNLPLYKQIFIFHNFFGIFLLFNPDIPRILRFLIFYVRSIHSLAIAIIYNQNYSLEEKITVAIFNAISVIIVVKTLELAFSCKNIIGRISGKIITLVVILGYYYIILSVISSQSPFESNQFTLTFILFFFSDILIFSVLFSIIQLSIANYILKSQQIQGLKKTLYLFIQLKFILISLIK